VAQAPDDDCQALDTGPIPNPAQAACDAGEAVVDGGADAVKDVVTAPVTAAGDAVMKGVTTWVANGASWLVRQAGTLIDETTTPRISSPWFTRQYRAMGAIAAVFALPLLLVAVIQAVLTRNASVLARAVTVNLPAAFLLTAGAVAVVELMLVITDQASAQVAASVGNDAKAFFSDTGKALAAVTAASGGTNPVPLFAVFLGGLIAAVGAFFVWIELLLRSAAIYVAVLFLPLTFVAMIWPQTARWAKKLLELLFALIVAKFVIVSIMALAAAGLGQSRAEDAFQGVLAGAALMVLAAFSPFVLLRLIPLAEGAVESARFRSGTGAAALGPVASPSLVMRRVMDGNWGAGGGLRAAPAGGTGGAGAGGGASAGAGGAAAGGAGVAGAGATGAARVGAAVRGRAENLGGAGEINGKGAGEGPARPSGGPTAHRSAPEAQDAGSSSPGGRTPGGAAPTAGGTNTSAAPRDPGTDAAAGGASALSERAERPVDPGPRQPRPGGEHG